MFVLLVRLLLAFGLGACAQLRSPAAEAPTSADTSIVPLPAVDAPPPTGVTPPIQTRQTVYSLGPNGYVDTPLITAYTNRSADTVYLGPCGRSGKPQISLQQWDGHEWRYAGVGGCHPIEARPVTVAPGQTRVDTTYLLRGHRARDPRALVGLYRVSYGALKRWTARWERESLLPVEDRVSNAFRIEP